MDLILRDEIKELMQKRDDFCVSAFLPTHRAGREIEQDPIRLDNLLRGAEKELLARGMRSTSARELLAPAFALMKEGFFTRRQADGLGIFASPGFFRYYQAPIHFQELLSIGKRFHFKPLVPLLNAGNRFYILAVSRKSVRLFQCTEFGVSEVELEGVPKSMNEALGYETEARLTFRATSVPMFHGHGGGAETEKEYLRNYFQRLRDSLHPYLRDEKAPLIFAGVEYLFPIFKNVNLYHTTMAEAIEGNPDGLAPEELHRRGVEIVGPHFRKVREEAIRRYEDTSCNGQCTDRLEKILKGAFEGRVDTLLVDTTVRKWGTFDPVSGAVEVHEEPAPGDEDLIDLATVETFLNGGTIYPVEAARIPGSAAVSAIFRY
ncbi:MAG: hypothetical protein WAW37_09710 [Syntrophobacteraceae bacterium]